MDHAVDPAAETIDAVLEVPPSKSLHQRLLVLDHLAERPVLVDPPPGGPAPGADVQHLRRALDMLGHWSGSALGTGRESLRLDFGLGATGLRFGLALAPLRPVGARSLLTGGRALLRRPHGPLLAALARLGARIKRRHSGSFRVHGGGLHGGRVRVDARFSSQFASALLLVAPRIGGLDLGLEGRASSLPYLRLTLAALTRYGVAWDASGLEGEAGRIQVAASVPHAEGIALEPDASAAAAWWTAVALRGGRVEIPGLPRDTRQADGALLGLLERLGARVGAGVHRGARVEAPGGRLPALGEVDLRDSPDLVFLVGVLAARSDGVTRIGGVAHTRGKESDRVAVLARGLRALGGRVTVEPDDSVCVQGGALHGGVVDVAGDHRAAFAFGVLGLVVPGVVLRGAQAVEKSHPQFLAHLARLARVRSGPSA